MDDYVSHLLEVFPNRTHQGPVTGLLAGELADQGGLECLEQWAWEFMLRLDRLPLHVLDEEVPRPELDGHDVRGAGKGHRVGVFRELVMRQRGEEEGVGLGFLLASLLLVRLLL